MFHSPYHEDPYEAIDRYGSPIWDNIYQVRMRAVDRLSTTDLQKFGIPTTFDPQLDRQLQNEIITIYLTIDAVFEHYRGHRHVVFAHNKDSESVYDIVNNYLRAWDTVMRDGVNVGGAPIKDLLELDEFAHKLFIQARMFNGRRPHQPANFVVGLRKGRGATSRTALLGQTADGKAVGAAKDEQHRSFAESLTKQLPLNEQPKEDKSSPAHRWRF
jgi:hypothetical protein